MRRLIVFRGRRCDEYYERLRKLAVAAVELGSAETRYAIEHEYLPSDAFVAAVMEYDDSWAELRVRPWFPAGAGTLLWNGRMAELTPAGLKASSRVLTTSRLAMPRSTVRIPKSAIRESHNS